MELVGKIFIHQCRCKLG